MAQLNETEKQRTQELLGEARRLEASVKTLFDKTRYEDLEHALLALRVVQHAMEEVLEHTGLGGKISHKPDPAAHKQVTAWRDTVKRVREESAAFLKTHASEDLENALRGLEIAEGSLHEVAEHYE